MSPSDAQRKAAAKYQKENIASLACRVKKEQAEKFKAYCAENHPQTAAATPLRCSVPHPKEVPPWWREH